MNLSVMYYEFIYCMHIYIIYTVYIHMIHHFSNHNEYYLGQVINIAEIRTAACSLKREEGHKMCFNCECVDITTWP